MPYFVYKVVATLGFVVIYAVLAALLSLPLRRSKVAHLLAAAMAGIAFLVWMNLPFKSGVVFLQYMTRALSLTMFLLVIFLAMFVLGWLAFRMLRSNDSFLKKSATALLIAAALSFLGLAIVSFVIFNVFLGGDPFHGKIVGNTYYFGRGDEYTRVTPQTWWISFWILEAFHCIPPLCLVSGLILTWLSRRREKSKRN